MFRDRLPGKRRAVLLAVVLSQLSQVSGCTHAPSTPRAVGDVGLAGRPFYEHCSYFESRQLAPQVARELRGRVWVSTEVPALPLSNAQVAARRSRSGEIYYTFSGPDGVFDMSAVSPGEYEVWACLEGFDEIRFRVVVQRDSSNIGLDLFLGPSEAGGRRDVVPIKAEQ
ncbi:MAG TPA: carboxypeptidase-like regulatory domain-containing protein [Thermoanaerobaculia bacterium]|nr:carboxypeptidase-like regulatory domain-containing protein [Thermoanaerobaculia bacterium]